MADWLIPERVRWAVETMAIRPSDQLLEIGCGRGAAVLLVCERLDGGKIIAIDRSAAMVRVARQRNQDYVASGKAVFQTAALDAADLAGERFDKIFAINVNLFWVRSSERELELVRQLLKPEGAAYLCYEPPEPARAKAIADRITEFLTARRFSTTTVTATTKRSTALVCLVARPT